MRNQIFKNTSALYAVQGVRKLIPLMSIPYLARVLGPEAWGSAAIALAFANFLVVLIEFGFNMSATREIARHRWSIERCREIVAGVISLQALFFIAASALSLLLCPLLPIFHKRPSLILAGLAFAAAQGFSPIWYLQGLERIQFAAVLDITGKILGLGTLLLFVHSSADVPQAVIAQAIAPGVTTIVGLFVMYRDVSFISPSREVLRTTLLASWPMFLLRAGTVLYGSANVFILGFFAPPLLVGYYTAADRIMTAIHGLLTPVADAFYPRLSHLIHTAQNEASLRLAKQGSYILISIGFALAAILFVAAPLIIRVFAGNEFAPAVTLLRIMSPIAFFAAVVLAAGTQWMLPNGRDKEMNAAVITGGLIDIVLACLLASRFMHVGLAWTGLIAEAFVAISLLTLLRFGSMRSPANQLEMQSAAN